MAHHQRQNSWAGWASVALLLIGGCLIFQSGHEKSATGRHKGVFEHSQKQGQSVEPKVSVPAKKSVKKKKRKWASVKVPQHPLDKMTHLLASSFGESGSLETLVAQLNENRQEPFITRQANAYTGEMFMVRAQKPLAGTRYFHAQYFTDPETGKPFVQHMSFELKKGKKSMAQAIASLKNSFGSLSEPTMQKANFMSWSVGSRYTLWVKKMDASDLKNNPFNAYSEQDVGTIRIGLELNINEG